MDRREFVKLSGAAAILSIGSTAIGRRSVWAQGEMALSGLGLPEVSVTLTEAGFQVTPSEAPAGWTLITFDNRLPEGNFSSASLMGLPAGETIESITASIATPSAEEEIPSWVYEAAWAGGPMALGGATAQAIVELTPGDWLVWSAGEDYPGAALTVTAAGDAASTPPTLSADVAVEMQEFAFVGLEQPISAGPHIWQVTTTGEQPHVMILFAVPEGTTIEQFLDAFMGMMSGSPTADGLDLESVQPAGGCAELSAGKTAWLELDLAAGSYAAVCFVPDQETGAPHIMLGMGAVFTVA
jgi:hypothetical protein